MRAYHIFFAIIVFLAAGLLPTHARAQGTTADAQWGIVPVPDANPATTDKGYFVYPMEAGAEASGSVLLRNPSATPVTIDLAAVNAETAQQGGSAFATEDGSTSGVASWIDLSERQVTVAPDTEQQVSFTVRAPNDVQPGQYLAGIAASEAITATIATSTAQAGLGAGVTMRSRYVIAVQADIGSAWTPAMSIPAVSLVDQPSGAVVGVQMRNDGDMFIKPKGIIVVKDATNNELFSHAVEMGTFVPGTEVVYPVRWQGQLEAGTYAVDVNLTYADGETVTHNDMISVSAETEQNAAALAQANENNGQAPAAVAPASAIQPWMIYMVAALLALIVVLLLLNLVRNRQQRQS